MARLISIAFVLAAALGLGFFFVLPQWQRFQAVGADLAGLARASGQFDALIANRDNLLGLINSITQRDLDRSDQFLPEGARASDFLVAMETLTSTNGLVLRRIDLVTPQKVEEGASPAGGGLPQIAPATQIAQPVRGKTGQGSGEETTIPGVSLLPFTVQVNGSYANVKRFLASLEKNIRLIDVVQINFNTSGRDDPFDVTLRAKTYYHR